MNNSYFNFSNRNSNTINNKIERKCLSQREIQKSKSLSPD